MSSSSDDESVDIPAGEVRAISKDTFRKRFSKDGMPGMDDGSDEAYELDYTPCINREWDRSAVSLPVAGAAPCHVPC